MAIQIKQYPISSEAREGPKIHIRHLPEAGIFIPCYSCLFQSAWNSRFLPVQKPGYGPVQDLREVNKRVDSIHPAAPNPYALLTSLPPEHKVCSVLDLKDAFFSVPLLSSVSLSSHLEGLNPNWGYQDN